MLKHNIFLLIVLLPTCLFSQSSLWSNVSASKKIMQDDCDKIFTHVEILPSLKISNEAFEDTLTSYLKAKKAFFKDNKIRFKFVVTNQSKIFDLITDSGDIKEEMIVREAIENFSNLWVPAKQNGHIVCAYVRLEIDIVDDKLHIGITQ